MSMFELRRSIDGVEVRPGMMHTSPVSTDRIFGRMIKVGGRCEAQGPERWTAIICADADVIWEGSEHATDRAAEAEAREHYRGSVAKWLRDFFA